VRTMLHIVLVGFLLESTAHRLPAPISEITEVRKQRRKPQTAHLENSRTQQAAPQPASRPAVLFAGVWTGSAKGHAHTFPVSDKSSSTYSIQVSPDEKTVSVEEKGNSFGCVRQPQIACRREADSLVWNYEQKVFLFPRITGTCTLRINSDGTAGLADDREYHGVLKLVLKISGTLRR
jgi:hypothetical protein